MAHNPCPVCQKELAADETSRGVCNECSALNGITSMPAVTRPALPCMRCRGTSFIRALPRELTLDSSIAETNYAKHFPMFVTYQPAVTKKLFGGYAPAELDPFLGKGLLELYLCRSCGYVEWYCHGGVPVGPQFMTEIVDVPPA